jgi:hypothetical protein
MVAPLKGVIRCSHCGCAMGPIYARKNGRHYTYYICQKDSKLTVIEQLSAVFRTPTLVAKTFFAARDIEHAERNRLIRLLVDKVEIRETGIDMELRTNGLTTLIAELAGLACEVTERRASR